MRRRQRRRGFLVEIGGDLHPTNKAVHIDGIRPTDFQTPPAFVADKSRAENVVVLEDGLDRRHQLAALNSGRQLHPHVLRESTEATAPLDQRPRDRGQRHPPDAAARQLLERHRLSGVLGTLRDCSQAADGPALEYIA
ncbi:hypothetical protein E143388_08475 [Rhodococcus opacus]|nr:hypothetical protein E143388_08475 [Rhodococcus opacus]